MRIPTHSAAELPGGDISIVLGTYNGAPYIERQLRSILDQTLPPGEIVVQDDLSSDDTVAIVTRLAAGSPVPIRLEVNDVNLGFADNFLRGAARASGAVVAFADQDDIWYPEKLERQRAALEDHAASLAVHAVRHIDAADRPLTEDRGPGSGSPRLLGDPDPLGNFLGFTMMFRRALLERLPTEERGLDPHSFGAPLSHDRWIYFLATTFDRTVVLPQTLADYRQHERQLFGGEKGRTRTERLKTKAAQGAAQSAYLADYARHLSTLLAGAGQAEHAGRWARLAASYDRRAALYREPGVGRRWRILASNTARGVYRGSRHGGLTSQRLLEDVAVTASTRWTGVAADEQ